MIKQDVLEELNIDSIIKLLDFLEYERSFEELKVNKVIIGENEYSIYKSADSLSICSNGKPLLYLVNKEVNPESLYEDGKRDLKILYRLESGDAIGFETEYTYDDDFFAIEKDKLVDSLKPVYYGKDFSSKTLLSDELYPEGLVSSDKGVEYHNVTLSYDGKEILMINGETIPSKQEIIDFDLDKEQEKLEGLKCVTSLNGVSKSLLADYIGDIDETAIFEMKAILEAKNKYLKSCLKDYDKVTDKVCSLIKVHDNFLDGAKSVDYSKEDLDGVWTWIDNLAEEKRTEKEAIEKRLFKGLI